MRTHKVEQQEGEGCEVWVVLAGHAVVVAGAADPVGAVPAPPRDEHVVRTLHRY